LRQLYFFLLLGTFYAHMTYCTGLDGPYILLIEKKRRNLELILQLNDFLVLKKQNPIIIGEILNQRSFTSLLLGFFNDIDNFYCFFLSLGRNDIQIEFNKSTKRKQHQQQFIVLDVKFINVLIHSAISIYLRYVYSIFDLKSGCSSEAPTTLLT